jgi:opacity protein-like surface antigen
MNIKSIVSTTAVIFILAVMAQAQSDINRVESFIGYSHTWIDSGLTSNDPDIRNALSGREGANGVNGSVTGNFSKYIGIKGDVAYHTKSFSDTFGTDLFNAKYQVTTVMGGVQFKNNMKDGPRIKPFAHVLAGLAHQKVSFSSVDGNLDSTDNSFTMAFGAGLDIRVHRRIDIRVIQFDYNPVFRGSDTTIVDPTTVPPTTVTFGRQDNFRIGFGIVIH